MTEATWQPIGDLLNALGVQVELGPNDLVASAVCVLAVLVEGSEAPQLTICTSEGLDWIHQSGLIRIAERMCSEPPEPEDEGFEG